MDQIRLKCSLSIALQTFTIYYWKKIFRMKVCITEPWQFSSIGDVLLELEMIKFFDLVMQLLFPNIINLINNLTIHAKLDFAKGVSITKNNCENGSSIDYSFS